MPQVMAQGNSLGQVAVELQSDRHRPGDLRYFEHVGQTGAVMVSGRCQKHLGLVL